MVFSSLNYLIFLPVVLFAYWLTSGSLRKVVLLIASYIFYMSWLPAYGLLLLAMTLFTYFAALFIDRYRGQKILLWLALSFNLLILAYYKYAEFLCRSFFTLISPAQKAFNFTAFHDNHVSTIILPLGISFFAFEFIHYCIDVHRGGRPIKNPLDFALFSSFFPSQISGPIKRYQQFAEQLSERKTLSQEDVSAGCGLIVRGLFKKVALADNLASITSVGMNNWHSLGTLDAWVLMVVFVWQVYFDFSGYTDIGIGSARLLGFQIPNNFDLPYIASKNLIEFWQRWHITLSTWLRDYVQLPMTGFRASRLRFNLATVVTMSACGLWHGAAWHFVAWGFAHGLILVATREYLQMVKASSALRQIHAQSWMVPVACLGTFLLVLIAQTLFLARSVPDAFHLLITMLTPCRSAVDLSVRALESPVVVPLILYAIWGLVFVEISWLPLAALRPIKEFLSANSARKAALFICVFVASIAFAPSFANPFIYFQF
jgi:D-alanyl-lipoteichoic acid acyltransferase DltB (MBOAT superfamily)